MCGRVIVKTSIEGLLNAFAAANSDAVEGLANTFPRWNGAPGLDYPLIVYERDARGAEFFRAIWGFVPYFAKSLKEGPRQINARSEQVPTSGLFKRAYASRRALMPVHGFFEWKATHGGKAKQPYAIAMHDDSPFTLAAIWESWRNRETGEEHRGFAVLTCEPNDLMATIHDRMPVIIAPEDRMRWLSPDVLDPRDLLQPFPSELMKMWPVDPKVGDVRNNTPDLIDEIEIEPDDLFDP